MSRRNKSGLAPVPPASPGCSAEEVEARSRLHAEAYEALTGVPEELVCGPVFADFSISNQAELEDFYAAMSNSMVAGMRFELRVVRVG